MDFKSTDINKLRTATIIGNIAVIFVLTLVIVYMIWADFDKDGLFYKVILTYATVIFSSLVAIKFLDYLDRKNNSNQ